MCEIDRREELEDLMSMSTELPAAVSLFTADEVV
jgi:hypothetical protein